MQVLELIVIGVLKLVDNLIGTAKTIFLQKNKAVLAAGSLIVSNLIYYSVIKAISTSDGWSFIIVASVASGIGCFLAMKINNKISKDRLFAHIIMSDNMEAMKEFRDFLAENHITNIATDCYTKEWDKTISITAYANTKYESKLIDTYIENNTIKFKHVIHQS